MSRFSYTRSLRCACGPVVVAVALSLSIGASTAAASVRGPAAGKALGGVTKQGQPATVFVSRDAKRVSLLVVLDMSCTSGANFLIDDGWTKLAASRNGSFHAGRTISADPIASVTGGRRAVAGRLYRKRGVLAGVWEVHLNYAFANGQTDSCDSGVVSFAAAL